MLVLNVVGDFCLQRAAMALSMCSLAVVPGIQPANAHWFPSELETGVLRMAGGVGRAPVERYACVAGVRDRAGKA